MGKPRKEPVAIDENTPLKGRTDGRKKQAGFRVGR
jgi:hypothetical protein